MANKIIPLIVYPVNMGYVSDLKPIIHGTGEPGSTINGTLDTASFTANILDNGVWSYKIENALADGSEHTLSVTQKGKDNEVSPATSVQFRADTKMLVQQAVTFPESNQFINSKTPVICGTGKAGAIIEASILKAIYETVVNQDGSWQIQITEPFSEGPVDLTVVQKDMGNISPVINVHFNVDTVAPAEPKLEKPREYGYENTPNPVVCGKGEPGATIDAIVDDKNFSATVNKSGDWNFEISQSLVDDTHIVAVKQRDFAGNVSPEKTTVFTVDTKQPEAPLIVSPSNGDNVSDNFPSIKGYGEKGSRIEIRLGEKVYSAVVNQDGTWEEIIPDALPDGTSTFKVYQIDEAENVSPSTDLTVKVDTSVPLPPVVLYPENDGYVSSTQFTVKGTGEPEASIELTVAGKNYSSKVKSDGSWSVDIKDNENIVNTQNYSIMAKQTDMAGNESPLLRVKFRVDTDYLKVPEITMPENGSVIKTVNPKIDGIGSARAKINVNISRDEYTAQVADDGTWEINISKSLPQGRNTVNVSQCDFGNVSTTNTVSFVVDTIAPAPPQITCPTENQSFDSGSLVINGNGEADAAVHIKLDDMCWQAAVNENGSWEFTVPDTLANGTHVILASQKDKAGNQSPCSQVSFVVNAVQQNESNDDVPIDCQVLYNPPASNLAAKVLAVLKTNKPVTVNNVSGNVFARVISKNGISTFDYVDSKGNKGSVSAGVTWIDDKLPVIQVESNGNFFSSDKTVTYYKLTGAGIRCALLNDVPFESGKVVTEEGIYKVSVTDQAGNTATEDFIIDKTPPCVSGVEDNKVYNADVCILYSDNTSGIKSALLNGKYFASGTVLTENGDYQLSIADFGDNTKEVHFKIQK